MSAQYESKTDEEIASFVQEGTTEAFGVLMDRYQNKLMRYGRKFLSNNEHIEDIVQDVFIKSYQGMQSFNPSLKFSSWIYRIAHNEFVSSLRKKQRNPLVYVDFDALVAHPAFERDPAAEEEREQMKDKIDKGLDSLPPHYKEVVILFYIEDMGYQEISDILHVPVGTVGIRLRRAREILKKHVQ